MLLTYGSDGCFNSDPVGLSITPKHYSWSDIVFRPSLGHRAAMAMFFMFLLWGMLGSPLSPTADGRRHTALHPVLGRRKILPLPKQ